VSSPVQVSKVPRRRDIVPASRRTFLLNQWTQTPDQPGPSSSIGSTASIVRAAARSSTAQAPTCVDLRGGPPTRPRDTVEPTADRIRAGGSSRSAGPAPGRSPEKSVIRRSGPGQRSTLRQTRSTIGPLAQGPAPRRQPPDDAFAPGRESLEQFCRSDRPPTGSRCRTNVWDVAQDGNGTVPPVIDQELPAAPPRSDRSVRLSSSFSSLTPGEVV